MGTLTTGAGRFTKPTIGGDGNLVWPAELNSNCDYLELMGNGTLSKSIAGLSTYTLVADGSSGDEARYASYKFTGALSALCTITIPSVTKFGRVQNATTGQYNIVLTTGGGTQLAVAPGDWVFFYCDGTNVVVPQMEAGTAPGSTINKVIDAGMIWSDTTGAVTITTGTSKRPAKMIAAAFTGAATVTTNQSTDAPTGYAQSVLVTVSTGNATVNSGDFLTFTYNIEDTDAVDLGFGVAGASSVVLSFWVKTSKAGTYGCSLNNGAGTRSYVSSFTVSANVWTLFAFVIPGDVAGSWPAPTNITGLQINITMMAGSSGVGTPGSWASSAAFGASGQTQLTTTTAATFRLTGLELKRGCVFTGQSFTPVVVDDLRIKRYLVEYPGSIFWGSYAPSTPWDEALTFPLPAIMRASPGVTFTTGSSTNLGSATSLNAGPTSVQIDFSAAAAGQYFTTVTNLVIDARL